MLVELLACSKQDLCARCVENGLNPKGIKNVLLMRLVDFHASQGKGGGGGGGGGGGEDGKGGGASDEGECSPKPTILLLGAECLSQVFQSLVNEKPPAWARPGEWVCDWRKQFVKWSSLAKVCTAFRDASRLLCNPILSRGSIRDWPEKKQLALIKMMCAKRQVLRELSLTVVDEVELPLLLMLVLKCDVSSLKQLKLISNARQHRHYTPTNYCSLDDTSLFHHRIEGKGLFEGAVYDLDCPMDERTTLGYRIRTSDECFSKMASSFGITLPRPEFFRPGVPYGLTLSLQFCPALTHLDIGFNFTLDSACFDAFAGCRRLKFLGVGEIRKGITPEPWVGHGLSSLVVKSDCLVPNCALGDLLPVLLSLTSLQCGDRRDYDNGDDVFKKPVHQNIVFKSDSLQRFAVSRKLSGLTLTLAKYVFPQLRVFHFENFYPFPPFRRQESGCSIVSFLDSFPLLEEFAHGIDDSSFTGRDLVRVRIPPGRPVGAATLTAIRRCFKNYWNQNDYCQCRDCLACARAEKS